MELLRAIFLPQEYRKHLNPSKCKAVFHYSPNWNKVALEKETDYNQRVCTEISSPTTVGPS